jgi:hypothetical protein
VTTRAIVIALLALTLVNGLAGCALAPAVIVGAVVGFGPQILRGAIDLTEWEVHRKSERQMCQPPAAIAIDE